MKIVFLDCDGVLNRRPTQAELDKHAGHWTKEFENDIIGLNPLLVKNLKTILDSTDAVLVASTSWRYFDDHPTVGDDWRRTLAEMLGRDKSIFVGSTPVLGDACDRRGKEIQKWMDDNDFTGEYVVIDDNVDDIVNIIPKHHIIHTDEKQGLVPELAKKAIGILVGFRHDKKVNNNLKT